MRVKVTYYPALCGTLFILFLLSGLCVKAQLQDDFSDGNFTALPTWAGNNADFIVNAAKELQLNASAAGTSYLSVSDPYSPDNSEWRFRIKLAFSPSSSNYARVYLLSDHADLTQPLNGYYIQLGETGANDQPELFRQSGTQHVSVCRGTSYISSAFDLGVKVTRNALGDWTLFIDSAGGQNYLPEAAGHDATHRIPGYFGLLCNYTVSNISNFYFDDLYIYAPPDLQAPKLDSVEVISSNSLRLIFNEPISKASAESPSNYFVSDGTGFAIAAMQDSLALSQVEVQFANAFTGPATYSLNITGTQDFFGNTTLNDTFSFFHFIPRAFDVQINEIMADVNPASTALPAAEYIELYNRSVYPVRLHNWTLSDASKTILLPEIKLAAESFVVLTSPVNAPLFDTALDVIGVSGLPALNDDADQLVLRNEKGQIISQVAYTDKWYADDQKSQGGWSLEQMDPMNPCAGKMNWKASAHFSGGTPGKPNSVEANIPDKILPELSHVSLPAPNILQVFFTEPMDSASAGIAQNYFVNQGVGSPASVDPVEADYKSVRLNFNSSFTSGIPYTLSVVSAKDCAGNLLTSGTINFAIDKFPSAFDLVINELLFDPKDDGVEWIEIYNRSSGFIDLKNVMICSEDASGTLSDCRIISPAGRQIQPGEYLVISEDRSAVKGQYLCENPKWFEDIVSLFTLNNDSDVIVLTDTAGQVIDKVNYHSDFHHDLLSSTKGVSLERISAAGGSSDKTNWHSASEASGGATPTFKNSQGIQDTGGEEVYLNPKVFSPDGDLRDDELIIHYAFDEPGYIGNMSIYDQGGHLHRLLVNNVLLGTSGSFSWNGRDESGSLLPTDMYIVLFELHHAGGQTKRFKMVGVLAGGH